MKFQTFSTFMHIRENRFQSPFRKFWQSETNLIEKNTFFLLFCPLDCHFFEILFSIVLIFFFEIWRLTGKGYDNLKYVFGKNGLLDPSEGPVVSCVIGKYYCNFEFFLF
jgi:hypothetical protein